MYAKDKTTIIDRREMLRVKSKSLAEEARIIRREELRTHGALRDELHQHRVRELRFEARATHLAYGFIKGRTLEQMEPKRYVGDWPKWMIEMSDKALFDRVRVMIKKYGPRDFAEPECMRAPMKLAA